MGDSTEDIILKSTKTIKELENTEVRLGKNREECRVQHLPNWSSRKNSLKENKENVIIHKITANLFPESISDAY